MEMDQNDLEKILRIRQHLIESHTRCRDYKSNKNAIMKESDHVVVLEKTIRGIDDFLSKYVNFSNN